MNPSKAGSLVQIKHQRIATDAEQENPRKYLEEPVIKKITFEWITNIMKLNQEKTFEQNMHYSLRASEQSSNNFKALEHEWQQLKDSNKSLLILRAIIRAYAKKLTLLMILGALRILLFFSNPLIINVTMKLLSQEHPPLIHVIGLLIFIPVINIIMPIIESHSKFALEILGINLKFGMIGLIYNKALKVSIIKGKDHSVGSIVNNYDIDCEKLREMMGALQNLFVTPIQMLVGILVIFYMAGPSSVGGLGMNLLLAFLSYVVNKNYSRLQEVIMKRKDRRIKLLNEVLNGIKYIKMSGLEDAFIKKIGNARGEEIKSLKERSVYTIVWTVIYLIGAQGGLVATVIVFLLLGNDLDATTMITLCSIFRTLASYFSQIPSILTVMTDSMISMRRIQKFLLSPELDLSYIKQSEPTTDVVAIKVFQGNFSWRYENAPANDSQFKAPDTSMIESPPIALENTSEGLYTERDDEKELEMSIQSARPGLLDSEDAVKASCFELEKINMTIFKGSFVAIIGDVGSGKSSLFYSLVGEMTPSNLKPPQVTINGRLAYLPQKPWIINATLRENILFGLPYDKERFDKVIKMAAMESDLKVLDYGDQTEIGEKGINLSGGQKARVSLARALYSEPDIFLLDDVLSAVDIHVGTYIMERCFLEHLAGKTRVLITHNLDYLKYVDYIYMMEDGKIVLQGTFEQLKMTSKFEELSKKDQNQEDGKTQSDEDDNQLDHEKNHEKESAIKHEKHQDTESIEIITSEEGPKTGTDELIQSLTISEDREKGRMKAATFKIFYQMWGGIRFFSLIVLIAIFKEFAIHGSSPLLAYWGDNPSAFTVKSFITVFCIFSFFSLFFQFSVFRLSFLRTFKCSINLHETMLRSVLQAPLNLFFDRVPTGRILNRFSGDIERIDSGIPWSIAHFTASVVMIILTLSVAVTLSSAFTIIPVFGYLWICHSFYQRYTNLNREMLRLRSIANSPAMSHLTETLHGLAVIRSFRHEKRFFEAQMAKMDEIIKNQLVISAASQWYNTRCAFGSAMVLIPISLVTLVWKDYINVSPAFSGVATSFLLGAPGFMTWFLWELAELEARLISFERCHKFTQIESEKIDPDAESPILQTDWPSRGKIRFDNYSTRYRPGLPLVLKGLNLTIQPGEKVGIVGRTGSGKSSLMLGLLRIIEAAEGSIVIDDVPINSVNLTALRDKITVIAQDPQLFEGTLRENVDVLERYSDEEVKNALRMVNLSHLYEGEEGLNKEIKSNGENLSAGERQMVCISRALLKRNKIILIDEATSNIDVNNEELFLRTIKESFADCTVLTVAHRLNTIINSDKIVVMNQGRLEEIGSPKELLEREDSVFRKMWEEAKKSREKVIG